MGLRRWVLVRCLPCKCKKNQSSDSPVHVKKLDIVAQACNPSPMETEMGGIHETSWPASLTELKTSSFSKTSKRMESKWRRHLKLSATHVRMHAHTCMGIHTSQKKKKGEIRREPGRTLVNIQLWGLKWELPWIKRTHGYILPLSWFPSNKMNIFPYVWVWPKRLISQPLQRLQCGLQGLIWSLSPD